LEITGRAIALTVTSLELTINSKNVFVLLQKMSHVMAGRLVAVTTDPSRETETSLGFSKKLVSIDSSLLHYDELD